MHVATPSVLIATLDNTAAVVSSIELRCRVCFEPLAQLEARAAFAQKRKLRGSLNAKAAELKAHLRRTELVRERAVGCEVHLATLQQQLRESEAELQQLMGTLRTADETSGALEAEMTAIRAELK